MEKKKFKIFSIFKNKRDKQGFKEKEIENARKRLESDLSKELEIIHKRDFSKNPLNIEGTIRKKKKSINKKLLYSNLKKMPLGSVFYGLDVETKKIINDKISSMKFSNYSEFEDFIANIISSLLMDSYIVISNKITDLIKSGGEVGSLSIESMEIPLKISLFRVTKSKKDFEKIEELIKKLNNDFLKIESFNEKQNKENVYLELKEQDKSNFSKEFKRKRTKKVKGQSPVLKKKKGNKVKNTRKISNLNKSLSKKNQEKK